MNFIGVLIADEIMGQPGSGAARPESRVGHVRARGRHRREFSALLKYPSGLIGAAHCGFNAHKRVCAEIIGTAGVLEIPDTFFDEIPARLDG